MALGRRVVQHVGVHRGRDEGRGPDREVEGGEEVVGEAERHPGDDVGGRGSHHEDVGLLGERDVPHSAGGVGPAPLACLGGGVGKQVLKDRLAGDGGKRQRRNKLAGRARQDDLHPQPTLPERPHQVRSLVGPDTPGNPDNNLLHGPFIFAQPQLEQPRKGNAGARGPAPHPASRPRGANDVPHPPVKRGNGWSAGQFSRWGGLRPASRPERAAKPHTPNPRRRPTIGAPVSDRHRGPRGPRNHTPQTRADDPPLASAGLRPASRPERAAKPRIAVHAHGTPHGNAGVRPPHRPQNWRPAAHPRPSA